MRPSKRSMSTQFQLFNCLTSGAFSQQAGSQNDDGSLGEHRRTGTVVIVPLEPFRLEHLVESLFRTANKSSKSEVKWIFGDKNIQTSPLIDFGEEAVQWGSLIFRPVLRQPGLFSTNKFGATALESERLSQQSLAEKRSNYATLFQSSSPFDNFRQLQRQISAQ